MTNTPNPTPTNVDGVTTATAIATGDAHTCVLLVGGSVSCWGLNDGGQLGNLTNSGTSSANPAPLPVTGVTTATAITASGADTCALLVGGTVTCWGRNQFGELGNTTNSGTVTANPTPLPVTGITTASRVTASGTGTCARIDGVDLSCWGSNAMGQLGTVTGSGGTTPNPTPATVAGVTPIVDADGGSAHVCALLSNATITCWGANTSGQAGNLNASPNPTPVLVDGLTSATQVVAGHHTRVPCSSTARRGVGASTTTGSSGTTRTADQGSRIPRRSRCRASDHETSTPPACGVGCRARVVPMTQSQSPRGRAAPATSTATRGVIVVIFAFFVGFMLLWKGGGGASEGTPENDLPGTTADSAQVTTTLPAPGTAVPAAQLKVVVANGSGIKGLAGQTADQLKAAGYTATTATDATQTRGDLRGVLRRGQRG